MNSLKQFIHKIKIILCFCTNLWFVLR